MAPSPQESGVHMSPLQASTRPSPKTGEEVVISGISGVFPKSNNTTQFLENLYNNVDMVTENDMNFHNPEAPRHLGQIDGMNRFDAQFFRMTYHHAMAMEPVSRKLLEQSYMAIYDSGINPLEIRTKKVGVFVGTSYSDTSNVAMYLGIRQKGYVLSGCAKSMFSNRISNFLDARGPSYSVDCSCASSMVCLEHAYHAIANGECEAAIVGGSNICTLPQLGLNLRKGGMACLDGKTKCFNADGDGPVRAEAVNCIFLQKAKDAKRIYAEVYFAQVTYGLKDDAYFLPTRRSEDIEKFLKNFYSEINVSPQEVEYIEADGSAIAEADENELKAIGQVFAKGKNKPVKVGSVKSNMGHAEPASGVCAITKVCLAYHKGKLPANLHYTKPLNVSEVREGKIKILEENDIFNRGLTAVNNFSFNGTNCHVLLKGHYKPKDTSKYKTSIPRLVLISGRHDESVKNVIKHLESEPFDPEVIGMLHNIYRFENVGHTSRGYTIIDSKESNETVTLSQSVQHYSGAKRPLWLVFSGMGSQWPGMGAELMAIPVFASTIQRCHKALEPMGVDLIGVITKPEKTMFENILNCFIGITAVQIGLIDVLKEIKVVPDYIIGHSQGETACAYWDDTFTTEETILAAYSRGIASLEANSIKGAMAAVGLGYKDISPLCPPEIDVACHNSNESVTISGPAEVLKKFAAELAQKGIFVREVPCSNLAFHSRYIRPVGPALMEKLKSVIKEPKRRSEKWISSSIPEERWHEDIAKFSSADYHTNNLLSPVYFEEASQHIEHNAVVVEVAPHGLLQAILKRSHPECTHVSLTRRGHENPLKFFLEAIGKIYEEGYNLKIYGLYPKIEYPVSTETKMTSHFVDWEHSEDWENSAYEYSSNKVNTTYRDFAMSIHDDEYKYIGGYIRDGKNVFPESAMLFMTWETLAMSKNISYKDMSVVFQDIQFYKEAIIFTEEPLRLNFMINKGNDYFEITQGKVLLANGFISETAKHKFEVLKEDDHETDIQNRGTDKWMDDTIITSDDLYEHFHVRGQTYKNEFQSIKSTNFKRTTALVRWNENWITLIDSLIQLNILAKDSEIITVPKIIKKLTINIGDFKMEKAVETDKEKCFHAKLYTLYDITRCAGIEMKQIIFDEKQIKQREPDILESLVFVPQVIAEDVTMETALQINLQLVADNILDENISIMEVLCDCNSSICDIIHDVAQNVPKVNIEVQTVQLRRVDKSLENSNLVILLNLFKNGTNINDFLNNLNKDVFVLTFDQSDLKTGYFDVVSSMYVQGKSLVLLKIKKNRLEGNVTLSIKNDETFKWVLALKNELQKLNKIILVSEKQPHCGLFGLVKSLRKDYPNKISLVVVDDDNASSFDQNNSFYKEQLQKGLAFNILHKGQWGSYYYLKNQAPINVQNIKLTSVVPGDINSLKWAEIPTIDSENVVQVCYAGPSVRDFQKAIGNIGNEEDGYGCDFSGFNTNGDRIMGLISGGAIASMVQADPHLIWQVPKNWSLEDAATVPLPYVQAFYCLAIKGQLRNEQSVFVNDGNGAFGQAVISIALSLDCTVYTSVDSDEKKQLLLKMFTKLKENNIGKSENGEFCTMVKIGTNGEGVDFVLNSASGYEREMVMKCVCPYGIFMDVNELDWRTNKPLGMSYIQCDRNYIAVILSSIFRAKNLEERKMLQCIVSEGIKNGIVRPTTRVLYCTTNVPRAFRLLTSKNNTGRILLKIRDADISTKHLNIIPRLVCSPTGTYIIVCDKTALGIHLAQWLVKHGARKIMLHLKSKTVSGFMQMKIASWMKLGTEIKISTENLHSDEICAEFLNEATKLGHIHGIFIIQETMGNDERWRQQDFVEKYKNASSVIAKLDVISRNNCPKLSEFVVISRSSLNAVDEFITSISDRICENRLNTGLPAVSFKIALLNELQTDDQSDKIQPQNITTVFSALEKSIKQKQYNKITFNLKTQRDAAFLDRVMRCLDIESFDNVASRRTVNDLITNDSQLEELNEIIKNTCKVHYDTEKLKVLRITSLISLANKRTKQNNKFNRKLGTFYTFVERDEFIATNPMVPMETIISKNIESNELDETATHLLLIPGFEGHHQIFKPMCETLKIRAMTFQLGLDDNVTESIREIANNILKVIKRNFVFKSKFYLLGYSFGVNVALEIAALLEEEDHVGLVYCLDSSPDALRVQLDAYIGDETDSQLQNNIIQHFFQLLSGKNSTDLTEKIDKLDNWPEKVDVCVNILKNVATYSHEYVRNTLESAYRRILLAKNYNPSLRLQSELVLLKGLPHPKSGNLDSDYGLSKYTKKPVKVINIPSDHAAVPQDCRISNIVNSFIDPELLENCFNLCHTYTI